jgi:hypothetical protein
MNFYNIMSCHGPDWTMSVLGGCSMAWFSFAIIFFLCLIAKRQAEDGFLSGIGFNLIGAFVGGLGANIVLTTLFGSARWSLLGGLLGLIVGGMGIGLLTGGGNNE